MRVARHFRDRRFGEFDQRVVEEDRLDAPDPLPLDLDVLVPRVLLRRTLRLVEHAGQLRRIEMTLVEQTFRRLDNRCDDAGLGDDAAHRADGALPRTLRDLADLELESRRARECVAALVHGCRAGVGGLSAEGDLVAFDAESAEDDSERELHRLEHGPLLDVELQIGGRALELLARVERMIEIDTELAQGVREGDPASVLQRAAEARALLVGPVDEPDGERRLPVCCDAPQHLDAGHHVQAAVEPAAVRHGVDVAADEDGLVGGAAQSEPLVARRVDGLLRPGPVHPPAQPFTCPFPGLRPRHPLRTVLVTGQLLELAELLHDTARLEWHAATLTFPAASVVSIA